MEFRLLQYVACSSVYGEISFVKLLVVLVSKRRRTDVVNGDTALLIRVDATLSQ